MRYSSSALSPSFTLVYRWLLFVPFPAPGGMTRPIGRRAQTGELHTGEFALLCCNFYADPSMDGTRVSLCMLRGISPCHPAPGRRAASAFELEAGRALVDYDEAGFTLQPRHKGVFEAWLGSTMSRADSLGSRLCTPARWTRLGDLNFRGRLASSLCPAMRRIIQRQRGIFLRQRHEVTSSSVIAPWTELQRILLAINVNKF